MKDATQETNARKLVLGAMCAVLSLVTLAYWGKGLNYLAVKAAWPSDIRLRWVDEQYIFAGRNPYDAFFATPDGAFGRRPLWNARDTSPLPSIGAPTNAGYPPWGFFAGAIFFWPDWPAVRLYFAAINILCGAIVFAWAYCVARRYGVLAATALGLSTSAMAADATTIGVGQYGVVIAGMLALSLWLAERNRLFASGVFLGLSFTKPTLSGPFALPFLLKRYWRGALGVIAYLAVADLVIGLASHTNPVEMLLQMLRAGEPYLLDAYGPLNLVVRAGVPQSKAVALTAAVFMALAAVVVWMWSEAPLLVQFAVASVAGRLWGYHKLYDNLILVFLLVALGELALRTSKRIHLAAFAIVGLTLWAPGKACDIVSFEFFQIFAWVGGLAILLAATPRLHPAGGQAANRSLERGET